jgi:hypothetical protein
MTTVPQPATKLSASSPRTYADLQLDRRENTRHAMDKSGARHGGRYSRCESRLPNGGQGSNSSRIPKRSNEGTCPTEQNTHHNSPRHPCQARLAAFKRRTLG